MNSLAIPHEQRFGRLREFLFRFVAEVVKANRQKPDMLAARPSDAFWALALPWILEIEVKDPNPQLRNNIDARKPVIAKTGFDGEAIARELKEIRENDLHLSQCCPTLLHLARHFSFNFLHEAVTLSEAGAEPNAIGQLYEKFVRMTYDQGPFRRAAFTHIFNLEIEGKEALIGGMKIIRLNPDFKSDLLREVEVRPYAHPYLHPAGMGDCFIYVNEPPSEMNDDSWLQDKQREAARLVMLLQYFKDGVVHLGYTVPRFYPEWTNQVRREGLFFIGQPRREPHAHGGALYKIEQNEYAALSRYMTAFLTPEVLQLVNDTANKTNNLRQATLRAGEYYEKSHTTAELPERLVYIAIAIEALFSPSNKEQLKFRIAQSAAQFLGESPEAKKLIFKDVQDFYDRRSSLVHGGYSVADYYDGNFVKPEEIERWSSLARRAILGFFILALRGEKDRKTILATLEAAAFDQSTAEPLRVRASVESYLTEKGF